MSSKKIFATIFVLACVLNCKCEECETYDGNGLCIPSCSDGRILYSADCQEPTMSERTCRSPDTRSLGVRCDYFRCECQDPKVWDEAPKKCVNVEECSHQTNVTSKNEEE